MKGPEPIVRPDGLAVVGGGLHLPDTALAAAREHADRQAAIKRAVAVLGAEKVAEIVAKADEVASTTATKWGVVYNALLNVAMAEMVEATATDGGRGLAAARDDARRTIEPNRAERRARTKANAKRVARVTTASQRDAATAGRSGRALHRKGEIQFFARTERRKPS